MKVVQINITCGSGSTGSICVAISQMLTDRGVENYVLYSSGSSSYDKAIPYQSAFEIKFCAAKSRVTGNWGFEANRATAKLLHLLETIRPDVVHLHNLHGHNINLRKLLPFLAKRHIKVFWTFHDCWAFTGYCPHYLMAACDKWKTGCGGCVQKKSYSLLFDRSSHWYREKQRLLGGLDLTVITPSQWLAGEVQQSFLKDVPVKVIHNGIDLSVFRPTPSGFREQYGLQNSFVILGVAFGWGKRKGLDMFLRLAEALDSRYRIVLVGTDAAVETALPVGIISIRRTADQRELAQIYSAADVFVNPTREDNYPTVHMEALACGLPVVTFDVGGSCEMLDDACGIAVARDDFQGLRQAVVSVCEQQTLSRAHCLERAKAFSRDHMMKEYEQLYETEA